MKKRVLGRTGLEVSEISLGGFFVSSYGAKTEQGIEVIRRALDLGINYIDTAPGYADSETVIGKALNGISPDRCFISTKLGYRPEPFNPKDRDELFRSVEESLRLLRRDYLDILMIHEPDRPGLHGWWDDWENFHGPVRDVLEELKEQKIIRFTGLGGTTAHELARIVRTGYYDVVLTAFNYSLLWREATWEIFPAAKEHKVGIIAGSPLQQGALTRRYDREVNSGASWLSLPRRNQFKALYRFLDEIKIPLPELALRFVISNPDIATVLTGTGSVANLKQNIDAVAKGPLSQEILARLQEIADMVPFRPHEELEVLPFDRVYAGPGAARE